MGSDTRGSAPLQARRPCGGGPPAAAPEGAEGLSSRGRAAEGWGISLDTPGICLLRCQSRDSDPGPRGRRPATTHRQARLPLFLALGTDALLLRALGPPLLLQGEPKECSH